MMSKKGHTLKILDQWFPSISMEQKTCELRKNDRDFQAGDTIQFIVQYENGEGDYINNLVWEITHVLTSDVCEGLKEGYYILSIKKYEDENNT